MKISTSQLFDNSVNQMNRQQSKKAEMQAKLASGKQIVKPSDDSEKSAVIQRLQTAIDRQSDYERSLDTAENRLASEESALMSSERILQRIRQLAVQGNTDTLSVDDKEILANEIASLREELLSLANTQDANGNYVYMDIVPMTYVLPGDYTIFVEEFKRNPHTTWIMKPTNAA